MFFVSCFCFNDSCLMFYVSCFICLLYVSCFRYVLCFSNSEGDCYVVLFFPECLTMRRQTAQRQKGEFTRSFDIHILLLLYGQTARERPDIRLSGYPAFLYPDGYSVYLI